MCEINLISIEFSDFGFIGFELIHDGRRQYYNASVDVDGFFFFKVYNGRIRATQHNIPCEIYTLCVFK